MGARSPRDYVLDSTRTALASMLVPASFLFLIQHLLLILIFQPAALDSSPADYIGTDSLSGRLERI